MVRQERGALQTRLPVILLGNKMKKGGERREGGGQQAGKMAKQVMTVLATKLDGLTSIPRTYLIEGEN